MTGAENRYGALISDFLAIRPDQVHLYWKGRVALYALLKAIGVGPGAEVIVPGLTCVVVPNAIKYLGAKPIYVDIDPTTFNMDDRLVEEALTPRTKVILAQNTFGLSPDLATLMKIASAHKLTVIEDCTHGFGGMYRGQKNGTLAHASFFSSQWNKAYSTGIGGFAVVNRADILPQLDKVNTAAVTPSLVSRIALALLIFVRKNLVTSTTYWPLLSLYRFLSRHNLVLGSSQGEELVSTTMPKGYFRKSSGVQSRRGVFELKQIEQNLQHRKSIAAHYKSLMLELGFPPQAEPVYVSHTWIKYPLLVKDRTQFLAAAEQAKIEMGDWFISPIHPVLSNWELWDYAAGACPHAEFAAQHLVNLPTHTGIDQKQLAQIVSFLRNHKDCIIGPRKSATCLN